MKNNRIIPVLCVVLAMASCKKETNDTDTTKELTTTEKVQQKWNLESNLDWNFKGKTTTLDYIDTIDLGRAGDYVDFRNDMKAYYKAKSGLDTFSIQELTLSTMQFIYRARNSDPYYDNIITLNR